MAISSAAALVFVTALAPRRGPGATRRWRRHARPSSCGGGRFREARRSPFPRGPWLPRSLPDWLARWRPAVAPRAKCGACRGVRGRVARLRLRTARPPASTHRPALRANAQCATGRSVLSLEFRGRGLLGARTISTQEIVDGAGQPFGPLLFVHVRSPLV